MNTYEKTERKYSQNFIKHLNIRDSMTQSNLMVAFPLYGLLLGFYKVSLLKSGTPVLLSRRDKKMASLSNPAKRAVIIEHNYR